MLANIDEVSFVCDGQITFLRPVFVLSSLWHSHCESGMSDSYNWSTRYSCNCYA